jgi:competence CoiA-like predicted nuclease
MHALLDGQRITAEPKRTGHCPGCLREVVAKCGPINAWHWAHKASSDCDSWSEPFTQWHADWQAQFPADWCEIPRGGHRADVRSPTGLVIEFQHSALSADEMRDREKHYGRMLWVFDAIEAHETDRLNLRGKDRYFSFRWKHPRRSILACRRPVFLDLGGSLLELKKMYPNAPYGGWGYLISREMFLDRVGAQR